MQIEFLCPDDARQAEHISETAEEFYASRRPDLDASELAAMSRWLAWKAGVSGQRAVTAGSDGDDGLARELEEWCLSLFRAATLAHEFSQSKES
ncbi:hypothetical protein TM1040_1630 [Ruegeria sp. TM1040]|uniref:hypothetical protein n=1 Tax=Ruegeria sp. (strain TM1040) TaxID=292414 RepID=UPI000046238C|nr:hypothetical protein [Ruegeria sp. TM1040]ABF64363.1 hypothetical protein TM1040_1630 [Ruegeria sp. TM1040]